MYCPVVVVYCLGNGNCYILCFTLCLKYMFHSANDVKA